MIDIWTIVIMVIMAPLALSAVGLVLVGLGKVVANIYIHCKYGLKYTDGEG